VPEPGGQDVDAARRQMRGVGVPQVVEPTSPDAGGFPMLAESLSDRLRAQRPPDRVGKEQVVVLVKVDAGKVLLSDLCLAMPLEPANGSSSSDTLR
jgi:hypothetical protein